jgi:hypothetical protein
MPQLSWPKKVKEAERLELHQSHPPSRLIQKVTPRDSSLAISLPVLSPLFVSFGYFNGGANPTWRTGGLKPLFSARRRVKSPGFLGFVPQKGL